VTHTTNPVVASGSTGSDLSGPEFTSELLAAIDAGLSIEDYLSGRSAGATHVELVETVPATMEGIRFAPYVSARAAGASYDDILAVWSLDDPGRGRLSYYTRFRQEGILHEQAYEAVARHSALESYLSVRAAGATHAEAMEVDCEHVQATYYTKSRQDGLTHDELLSSHRADILLSVYRELRKSGACAKEAHDAYFAFGSSMQLDDYKAIRRCGANHNDALDVVTALSGAAPLGYFDAIRAGATHAEIRQALDYGSEVLSNYGSARLGGYSHQAALAEASSY
jgi:hypothetical protein